LEGAAHGVFITKNISLINQYSQLEEWGTHKQH